MTIDINKYFWLTFLVSLSAMTTVSSTSFDKDLTLTLDQKMALDEFVEMMRPRVPHDWMKTEIYLVRWLRAKDFNLRQAERMLMDNLKWREDNKMDQILDEDFSDVEQDYKYWISGHDREGKPLAYFNLGNWNIRKAVISGSLQRGLRYLDKYMEEITSLVRKMQDEGKNVTQYSLVVNMYGFSAAEHLCLQCLPAYLSFQRNYENRYPGMADISFIVNTPRLFEVVLNAIKPNMSPATRDSMRVYSTNKREWQPILFSFIARDQLPREVGGTRIYTTDDLDDY